MPKYWKITNRAFSKGVPTGEKGTLQYFVTDADPTKLASWNNVSAKEFKKELVAASDQFPLLQPGDNEDQNHVTFLIHGYNNGWQDAANLYKKVCDSLYTGPDGFGICISFDWPSLGSLLGYLPDRDHARKCADDLATVFSDLYDWMLIKQDATAKNPEDACKAKISVIAHSMGNYVTQKALAAVWTRKNQPLLVSLINQLVMIAADVDNDLFESNASDGTDGDAMANLTYRITSLFSGRDAVLGASAGLKHFGTRRLGRSGLAFRPPDNADGSYKDNVWDNDCSSFFSDGVTGLQIHGAYFDTPPVMKLVGDILSGVDRSVLDSLGETTGDAWSGA